jgi:hypothetical protein
MVSASAHRPDILGRQREGFADVWSHPVYLAAPAFGIMDRAPLTASAASYTFTAPFAPPRRHLSSLGVPDNPSSYPSVQHGKTNQSCALADAAPLHQTCRISSFCAASFQQHAKRMTIRSTSIALSQW